MRLYKLNSRSDLAAKLAELGADDDSFFLGNDRVWAAYTKAPGQGNGSLYMSFFYHLRNVFAHARWTVVDNDFLVFEDGKETKGRIGFEVSARGIMSVDSLISLIELIQSGPSERPDVENLIYDAIHAGLQTRKQIIEALGISMSDWSLYSQVLRSEGKIVSRKSKWFIAEELKG